MKALDKLSSRRGRPTGQQFFRSGRPFNQAARGGGSYGSSHRAGSNNAYQKRQIPRKRSLQAIPGEGPASKKAAAVATATVVTAEPVVYTTEIVYVYRDLPLVMCAAKSYC